MRFLHVGLNGDYVYSEKINGHAQTVRIGIAVDKKDARKKAKAAFDELKSKLAAGTAEITESGKLILK